VHDRLGSQSELTYAAELCLLPRRVNRFGGIGAPVPAAAAQGDRCSALLRGVDVTEVHEVLDALTDAGCSFWVGGGWGVDALVGRQTRCHRDLDLAIDARDEACAIEALFAIGYRVETDWRPVRVELRRGDHRWVDLHPVHFDEHGNGRQHDVDGGWFLYPRSGFTTGRLGDAQVLCLTADQQIRFHMGYTPRPVDHHDLALLRALTD
jgi:lincosamide nucleotidyltransferase A/C/D/E